MIALLFVGWVEVQVWALLIVAVLSSIYMK